MNNFGKMGLSPEILEGVKSLGFEKPFPIQEAVIPLMMQRCDVIGQAHTGTGKTAAFGLPLLEVVDQGNLNIQALVLVPTRELASQVAEDLNAYGKFTRTRALAIYGGESINLQMRALKDCPQIIVATPGRLIDHLERRSIYLAKVSCVVLDEADRMLDMGFIDDVERILAATAGRRQIAFFSATISREVLELARRHMKDPREILIEPEDLNVKEIRQYYCEVDQKRKLDALMTILEDKKVQRAIIFCRTKHNTFWLNKSLGRRNQEAIALNGDLTQVQRDRAMHSFRSGRSRLLVATDLAGRGLDVDGITHIINYDVPQDPYTYFHRIGRTGRAGRIGTAVTIVSQEQDDAFRAIQSMADDRIERLSISTEDQFTAPLQEVRRTTESRRAYEGKPYGHPRHGSRSRSRYAGRKSHNFTRNRNFS